MEPITFVDLSPWITTTTTNLGMFVGVAVVEQVRGSGRDGEGMDNSWAL